MSSRLRIVQVCPYDWNAPGGVQRHVRSLSEALIERDHDVTVVAPGNGQPDAPWVRFAGTPIRVPFNGSLAPICPDPRAGWKLQRLLRAHRPDIVHAHEPIAPSLGLYAGLVATAPVVGTFHAHCVTAIGRLCYAVATQPFNARLSAGIAVSRAAIASLRPGVRVPFEIVPNGVGPEFFEIGARRSVRHPQKLLFAHRLEPRKGFGVAIDAFAELSRQFADLELVVVGEGPDGSMVETLDLDAKRRVRMCGVVSRERFLEELQSADMLLAPALGGESFGMVVLEAMAAALPVVASDIDGYRDLVRDGAEGRLVPPGDARAVASAVRAVRSSIDVAWNLGRAGHERARSFTWDRIADEVEHVYERALGCYRPRLAVA